MRKPPPKAGLSKRSHELMSANAVVFGSRARAGCFRICGRFKAHHPRPLCKIDGLKSLSCPSDIPPLGELFLMGPESRAFTGWVTLTVQSLLT